MASELQLPTLREAVAVLNERGHAGMSKWQIERRGEGVIAVVGDYPCEHFLTPFEAVAIAARYLRGDTEEAAQQAAQEEMREHPEAFA